MEDDDKKKRPKKTDPPPPDDGNVSKLGTTGHEGGYAFNADQRGGHTDPPKMSDVVKDLQTTEAGAKLLDEPPKPAPNRRKLDPELKAMDAVCEVLEPLDPSMRWRVLDWCMQRFYPPEPIRTVHTDE